MLRNRLRVIATLAPALALGVTLALPTAASAQDASAAPHDKPKVRLSGKAGGKLENSQIAAEWKILRDGKLGALRVVDKDTSDNPYAPPSIELTQPFSIEIAGAGVLNASSLIVQGDARIEHLTSDTAASRFSDRLPGTAIHYKLADPGNRFTADWALILRDGSSYIRQQLTLTAGDKPVPVSGVMMIDVRSPRIQLAGHVKGSPLIAEPFFLGFEQPLSESSVVGERGTSELHSEVPLGAGQTAVYSSVVGVAQTGQMRRAFLTYLERERAHPYRTFLHYNSWFDIGYEKPYTQQQALARIHEIGDELNKKRGVTLDSYLFDDGWDDTNDLWKIRSDFKDGFAPLTKAAAEYGAAAGVWLSPWGGYADARKQRVATAKRDGYEIVDDGLALSGPKYYALFHAAATDMVTKYGVNQFKFDGTGNVNQVVPGSAFNSDFDAAIHLISDLRRIKPDIYINLTSGTWPSPFWLLYADSTWRGGDDTSFAGVGTQRERWITYRDADTYEQVVKDGRLFPLSSLMLHGIVFAQQAEGLSTASLEDFTNEVHSYFGNGTQLQELYITPSLLTPEEWDVLADAAKWSRANASTLLDTHWVGGDPEWLQVYGWAAWSKSKGILTLRNPSSTAQDFEIDIAQAFELPASAPHRYIARSPWASDNTSDKASNKSQPAIELEAGKPHTFHLAPFQVLNLEAVPQK